MNKPSLLTFILYKDIVSLLVKQLFTQEFHSTSWLIVRINEGMLMLPDWLA